MVDMGTNIFPKRKTIVYCTCSGWELIQANIYSYTVLNKKKIEHWGCYITLNSIYQIHKIQVPNYQIPTTHGDSQTHRRIQR